MIKTLRLTVILSLLMISLSYQTLAQSNKRQDDEKLARQFYNAQQYDKASDMYLKLYQEYNYYQYLSRYVDCQYYLNEFEPAVKELRSFIKRDNTTNKWKAQVDLSFIFYKQNEIEKADKQLNRLIDELPESKSSYSQVASFMRTRGFNEYAASLYEKGSESPEIDYKFYVEKADVYNSLRWTEKSVDNYLLYLEESPENRYDHVKSRLSFMLRYDIDDTASDIIRIALLKRTQSDKDNEWFANLLVWYAIQIQDYEIALNQEIALDKRLNDREYDIIHLAHIAENNEQYDVAMKAYNYIIDKSKEGAFYPEAVIGLTEVQYTKMETLHSDVPAEWYSNFEQRIEKECLELGISDMTVSILSIRAEILAFKLGEIEKSIEILNDALTLNLSKLNMAKVKMKLADIYLFKEEVWEATLLYSQVDKAMKEEPIGHEARFKNAQLRYYIGEFDWALAVLNILKSATSKLIANDAMTLSLLITDNLEYDTIALQRLAKADFYIYQKKYDLADKMLDSVNIYNPNEYSMPYLLSRKAQIALENQDYNMADSLYKRIYQGYEDSYMADKALLEDAILLERFLDKKEEAMECYARLIDEYTASVYVAQARNAYRRLRD